LKADKILLKISSAALNIILASSVSGDPYGRIPVSTGYLESMYILSIGNNSSSFTSIIVFISSGTRLNSLISECVFGIIISYSSSIALSDFSTVC